MIDALQGGITVGLDATSMFCPDEMEGYKLQWPSITPSTYMLKYHFKAPLPRLEALWTSATSDTEGELLSKPNSKPSFGPSPEGGELYVNATFGGPTRRLFRNVEILNTATNDKETRKVWSLYSTAKVVDF